MAIRKLDSGKFELNIRPNGAAGKQIKKRFGTRAEAKAYERYVLLEVDEKPWLGEKKDHRRLSELVDLWYKKHGVTQANPDVRLAKLKMISSAMGDPIASKITAVDFTNFREKRLSGDILYSNSKTKTAVCPRTVNHDHSSLHGLFSKLKELGEWTAPNPLADIKPFKIDETELTFLHGNEIESLLAACLHFKNQDLLLVVKICLATGCRWSEAETLKGSQLVPCRITFVKTKGKRNRTVPISQALYDEIPKRSGRIFGSCRDSFVRAVEKAGLNLPEGQSTHVLRHSFASHFMMNGGNILVLQRILGHQNIKETMKYAHFSPDHLEDAVTKNPLENIGKDR